jgi:hypothetical protein
VTVKVRAVLGLAFLAAGAGWLTTGAGGSAAGLGVSVALGVVGGYLLLARLPRLLALVVGAAGAGAAAFLALSLHETLRGERPYAGPGLERARPATATPTAPTIGRLPAFASATGTPVRLVVWGDCRGGVTVFERLLDAIRERRPDATIGLGDFVGMARVHAFEILRDKIASTGVPAWLVPGNHDLDPDETLGPYGEVLGAAGWSFPVPSARTLVVGLDSARGVLAPSEADRLERAVAEAGDGAARLVVCLHHPLWAPPTRPDKPLPQDDPSTKRVQAVCQAKGALVLCSHWHGYDRSTYGSAVQVVTGGAGSRLEADDPYHYLWVEVRETGATVERVDLAPGDFDTARIDRWKTFRDEALWAAKSLPARALGPWAGLAAALGGLGAALRPRRRG